MYAGEGHWSWVSKWLTGWKGKEISKSYTVYYHCDDMLDKTMLEGEERGI